MQITPTISKGRGCARGFCRAGMQRYARSLRVQLVWLVYIIPITVVGVLIYLVNYA